MNTVEQVVADTIEHLPKGPSWMADAMLRDGAPLMAGMSRAELVAVMIQASASTTGDDAA